MPHRMPLICVDIETIGVKPDPITLGAWEASWKPPANYKDPSKIEARKAEQRQAYIKDRSLTVEGAQVISVALAMVSGDSALSLEVKCSENEVEIAKTIMEYVSEWNAFGWLGFNIKRFDLPIMALLLYRHGIELPVKPGKWETVDLFDIVRDFNRPEGTPGGLKYWAKVFGVASENPLTGADVAGLWEEGNLQDIAAYNAEDVRTTIRLYAALRSIYDI